MLRLVPNKMHQHNVLPSYKGGDTCIVNGYVFEFLPTHWLANGWGWVAQHRIAGEDIVMTKRAHMKLHAALNAEKMRKRLSDDDVRTALSGRTIRAIDANQSVERAAKALHMSEGTIRKTCLLHGLKWIDARRSGRPRKANRLVSTHGESTTEPETPVPAQSNPLL